MRVAVVLAIAAATVAPPAAAQSISPTTVTVDDFAAVTLNGAARSTTAAMSSFSVTDAAGAGWHVTVNATQFAEVDGAGQYVTGGKTLPVGSLTMPAPTVSPAAPGISVTTGPYAIDGATVKIVSAVPATFGTFDFTHEGGPLSLSLPASAYARAYRSEITVAVTSGP